MGVSGKEKEVEKAKKKTFAWEGCIEFRGKGKNRQGLLIWTNDNLRESNWLPLRAIKGLPRGGTGPAPHRLLLEQRVDKNSAWSALDDVKHEVIVDVLTKVALEVNNPKAPSVARRSVHVPALGRAVSIENDLNAEFQQDGSGPLLRWTLVKTADKKARSRVSAKPKAETKVQGGAGAAGSGSRKRKRGADSVPPVGTTAAVQDGGKASKSPATQSTEDVERPSKRFKPDHASSSAPSSVLVCAP